MNRDVLDNWCERGILVLVLAILVFGPLATGAVRSLEFLIIQGLTLGVMLLWTARIWVNRRIQFLWPPICWAVIAFAGYAVGRYLTCDIEYVGRRELIRVLIYTFLFFAVLNNLHRQEFTQVITFTLVFLAMGISCYAFYQFLSGSDRVWHFVTAYKGHGCGTYINPNHLGGFLEMLLPLALAYPLVGRSRPVTKIFLIYAALVILVGIAVTMSRGSWMSCGLSLMFLFGILTLHRNYRIPALLLMTVLLAGGLYLASKSAPLKNRFNKTVASKHVLDVRYYLWDTAIRMWREHVWFGVGPGHYDYRFRFYRPEAAQFRPDRVHNDYLNTLTDWGVVGAVIVAAAVGALFAGVLKCWRHVRREENDFKSNLSNKFAFVLGSTLGLVALLAHSFLDFNLHIPANAILAVSLAALLTAHLRFATEKYWVTAKVSGKMLATTGLAAGLAYLTCQEVRLGREYVWLDRALHLPFFSPARITALKNAAAAEPANFDTAYALGELFRVESFEGGDNFSAVQRDLANEALQWYARAKEGNPHDGFNDIRYGMCLDWLGRHDEAERYFNKADELDPKGYFTSAHVGWHYVQIEDYAAARNWLERSLALEWKENSIAAAYLPIVIERLAEGSSNPVRLPAPRQE